MKTVDKYQFNQDQAKVEAGIESFLAYHTVLKKHFTLKRICLNSDTDQSLYNLLTKEVSIVKKLNHPSIYRCHKMLKTKNNLYLIYDNIEGDTLEKLIQQKINFQTKLSLVKQISSVLLQLRKNNLSHLVLSIGNVVVQAENKIKVINFDQAVQFSNAQQTLKLAEPIKSKLIFYVAPEAVDGQAHISSDVYSFGMIIMKLFEQQFEDSQGGDNNGSNESKWINKLFKLANKMTIEVPELRISIKQVDSSLQAGLQAEETLTTFKSSKSERIIQLKKPSISKNISDVAGTEKVNSHSQQKVASMSSRKILTSSMKYGNEEKVVEVQALMRKILKKRNLVIALLYMVQACSNNIEAKSSTSIILSFLLTKKAAICISQLAKLLKTGRGCDMIIEKKVQDYFFKTNFFLKMNPIINKQMISTQQSLQRITSQVTKLEAFSTNSLLMEEVRHQKMNNSFLRKTVFQFLNSLSLENSLSYCENYELNHVIGLYLISLLSCFNTYEEAHEKLFSESSLNFEDDPLIKSLVQFKKETVLQLMEIDLELNQHKLEDNISLTKSAKTIK